MKFEYSEKIRYPAQQVYEIMRDQMEDVVPLVENVESVTVREREEMDNGRLRIVNLWQGSPSSTPAAIRPFIKPEMTQWIDHALWDDENKLVEWRFETEGFASGVYECSGINYWEADPDNPEHCIVRLTGDFVLYPEKLPGVNRFLAKKLGPVVEKWLLALISPNLADTPRAVQAYLDNQQA